MKNLFTIICCLLLSVLGLQAQDNMRIHYKNGSHSDVPIEEIDSITFVDKTETEVQTEAATLVGRWLWGRQDAGYYELLTFKADKTYTGYDNYFTYGFDTMTYGWYSHYGAMLTLWSNGFGYQYRYNWFVMAMTENALDVMTRNGRFTYYRLQPETIRLTVGQTFTDSVGTLFLFADGIVVQSAGNQLTALSTGTTYVLKQQPETNVVLAYQVIVE